MAFIVKVFLFTNVAYNTEKTAFNCFHLAVGDLFSVFPICYKVLLLIFLLPCSRWLITKLSKIDSSHCWRPPMLSGLLVSGWNGFIRMWPKDCKPMISRRCLRLMHVLQDWSLWLLLPLLYVTETDLDPLLNLKSFSNFLIEFIIISFYDLVFSHLLFVCSYNRFQLTLNLHLHVY